MYNSNNHDNNNDKNNDNTNDNNIIDFGSLLVHELADGAMALAQHDHMYRTESNARKRI